MSHTKQNEHIHLDFTQRKSHESFRAKDARMYVVMEKGSKCKDIIEVRCGGRYAAPGLHRLLSFWGQINGLNSHSVTALGVYQISREKGEHKKPMKKKPRLSPFLMICTTYQTK